MEAKAAADKRDNRWLLGYARKIHSQNGEDGIIEKVLEIIGDPTRWCVEFGAWDGRYLSNVCHLIESQRYAAVLIEGSASRFDDLVKSYEGNDRVFPIRAFVGFGAEDGLDVILSRTEIPREFDVLSIDIDGNDFHVWKAMTAYRPRLVVIEYNPTIPSQVDFVQPADMSINQGASILALTRLAKDKGYELIATTQHNCFFVAREYFSRFGIEDNSVNAVRCDDSLVTYVFNGFDGTVFVRGYGKLAWHGVPYKEAKLQVIPRMLRKFPDNSGRLTKFLAKHYRSLKKRGWI